MRLGAARAPLTFDLRHLTSKGTWAGCFPCFPLLACFLLLIFALSVSFAQCLVLGGLCRALVVQLPAAGLWAYRRFAQHPRKRLPTAQENTTELPSCAPLKLALRWRRTPPPPPPPS